ncbi:MAG: hypothetical protein JXN62_13270 [Bacteroidales bacterium]|nr:hypothetical protein [Bacteroidales bacterium]
MLKTLYDYNIYKDFIAAKPDNVFGDDFRLWRNYFEFLKSGTDLMLANNPGDLHDNLINELTTGRGETRISSVRKFKGFHKNRIPKSYGIDNLFFIDEPGSEEQKRYRSANPYFFGFINDHLDAFAKLSFAGKKRSIPVRSGSSESQFTSWSTLDKYILPFSDCIIIDNYIFSQPDKVLEQNIGRILQILDKTAPSDYNILIITFHGKQKQITLKGVRKFIEGLQVRNGLRGKISVIVTRNIEHDRNIIMNYMRIYSGNSFNYFDKDGRLNDKIKTQIDFLPLIDPEQFYIASSILSDVSKEVSGIIKRADPEEVYGDCRNRLLLQE